MNLSPTDPPHNIRERCEAQFDLTGLKPVFTYEDTIYFPYSNGESFDVDQFLLAHEMTHTVQQGKDPEGWWEKYLTSPEFRFSQELEAYQNHYKAYKDVLRDRNALNMQLHRLASYLCGPMYGSLCTHTEAMRLIKTGLSTG